MAKFVDADGRPWSVRETVGAIKDVRDEIDVDLADIRGETLDRIAEDPVLLVDVLWLLCQEQAKGKEVSAKQFGESLVGDAIDAAAAALVEAICDFFPSRRRTLLRKVTEKTAEVREKADRLAMAKIADPELERKLTEAMQARMEAELERALTRFALRTNSPESSESNPTARPSVN